MPTPPPSVVCPPAVSSNVVIFFKRNTTVLVSITLYDVWVLKSKITGLFDNIWGYVEIGETPVTAGTRVLEEQTQIIVDPNAASPKLIGVYNDPAIDISEELRSTITISHAIEYIPSEMSTTDGTNIPKATNQWKELMTIPLEEVGSTYTQSDFEENHFSYHVLMDLKDQLNITSSNRRDLHVSHHNAAHSTCSH
ncbi:hypothetical protein ACHAXN_002752 [Cyclotella atomus]